MGEEADNVAIWLLKQRKLTFTCIIAISIVCISLALCFNHIYSGYFGQVEAHIFRSTHLTFILILAFFLYPTRRKQWNDRLNYGFLLDLILVGTAVAIQIYILYDYEAFCNRISDANTIDSVVGAILVVLVLEAARRTIGWSMFFICLSSVCYALYSNYLFGFLEGPPVSYHWLFSYMLMEEGGVYGIPIMAMASFIMLFLIFGAFLIRSGAAEFFVDLSVALTGRQVGGPGKSAVIASMLMGSLNGSCVANVITTGSVTIPLMKKVGYAPRFAGAVEAVASTGGPFMPPVMGAAGFIIAAFLGVSYLEVVIAAALPAILYFLSLFFMVHFEALRLGLKVLPRSELPSLGKTLKGGWYNIISLLVIMTFIVLGYSVGMAAFWGIITVFVLSFFSRSHKMTPDGLLIAFCEAARMAVPVSIACAASGLVIGSMTLSGLSLRLSGIVIALAGGHLWLILIYTSILCLILGMGLPTTAIYIVVSAVIVPVLVETGVVEMGAHLFAFYFGVISAITPPVCMAAFAAAGISGSSPMKTGFLAVRIGIAAYIVPFMFVYNPALLFEGNFVETFYVFLRSSLGVICLASGVVGMLVSRVSLIERVLLVVAAFSFLKSSYIYDFIGLSLLIYVLIKGGAYTRLKLKFGRSNIPLN